MPGLGSIGWAYYSGKRASSSFLTLMAPHSMSLTTDAAHVMLGPILRPSACLAFAIMWSVCLSHASRGSMSSRVHSCFAGLLTPPKPRLVGTRRRVDWLGGLLGEALLEYVPECLPCDRCLALRSA